jgi:hypothetical protein
MIIVANTINYSTLKEMFYIYEGTLAMSTAKNSSNCGLISTVFLATTFQKKYITNPNI